MRIDKAIASQGAFSRSEIKKLIRKGEVNVDGHPVRDPGTDVDPEQSTIRVAGSLLRYRAHLYLMLNKPTGVVSATEDRSQRTVLDLVPKELYRGGLFPAGRLDLDTTGFVLLTDDGAFAHRILSPQNHIWKTYVASLAHAPKPGELQPLLDGIRLRDGTRCQPAKVHMLDDTTVEIRICEGIYHQIKRMFAATGNHVERLHRTAMGGLPLDPALAPGDCRELTAEEMKRLTEPSS